jgi:hypothetical protein
MDAGASSMSVDPPRRSAPPAHTRQGRTGANIDAGPSLCVDSPRRSALPAQQTWKAWAWSWVYSANRPNSRDYTESDDDDNGPSTPTTKRHADEHRRTPTGICEERAVASVDRVRANLPEASRALIRECLQIVAGEEEEMAEDDTFLNREPGYEKSAQQRLSDCQRVRQILASGALGVSANLVSAYGEPLLLLALEYDYGHGAQMTRMVLEAGADPNLPSEVDGVRPLDSHWLSHDGSEPAEDGSEHAARNAEKRACLIAHGADPLPQRTPVPMDARARGAGGRAAGAAAEWPATSLDFAQRASSIPSPERNTAP